MEWEQIPNIEMVTDGKLAEVFARTRVGVAHYSSSLMEGVAHGAVPLVYDPTEGSRYSPDVDYEVNNTHWLSSSFQWIPFWVSM